MLARYRNTHQHKELVVLASGPTLSMLNENKLPTIAVNAVSLSGHSYDYYMCGDLRAPLMEYFKQPKSGNPARIVSSFLAPFDRTLYPEFSVRKKLQKELRSYSDRAHSSRTMHELYPFTPAEAPLEPHAFFQYSQATFPKKSDSFFSGLETGKFFHGATITGVAMQMAWWMGAKTIHLFGCSMDNESGTLYGVPTSSSGGTTPLQIRNMKNLILFFKERHLEVVIHGPSKLKEEGV